MEVPLPGMHLLANILLSNALSTMNNSKKVEGELVFLPLLLYLYFA
jgi:hypothetical protein